MGNFETKEQRRLLLMNLKSFVQISNLSSSTKAPLYPLMHVLDLSGSPIAKDLQVKIGFRLRCRNNREPEWCLTRTGVQKIMDNLGLGYQVMSKLSTKFYYYF